MQEDPEETTTRASAASSAGRSSSVDPSSEQLPPSLHLSFQLPPKADTPVPTLPKRRGPKKQYKRGRNESQKQVEARIRLHEHRQRWLRQIQTPGGPDDANDSALGPDDDGSGGGDDDGWNYSPHEEPSPPATPLPPPQLSAVVAGRRSSSDDPATKKRHRRKESERLLAEAGAAIKQEQGTTQLDESALASGWKTITKPKKGLAKGAAKDEEETVYVGPDGKEYRSLRLVKRIIDGTHYKKFDGDDDDEGHSSKTPAKRYRRHSGEPRDARADDAKGSPIVSPLPAQAKSEPASQNSMLEVAQFLDALATAAVSQTPTSIMDNGGRQRWTEAGARVAKSDEVQDNAGARANLSGHLLGMEAKEIEGSSSDSGTEEVRRQQQKLKRKRPTTSRTQATRKRSHTETVSVAVVDSIQARTQAIIARSNRIVTSPVEAGLNRGLHDSTRGPPSSPGLTASPLPPVHRQEETAISAPPPPAPTNAAAAPDQNHEEHKVRLVMRQLLDHFSQHLRSSGVVASSSFAANQEASNPHSGPSLLQKPSPPRLPEAHSSVPPALFRPVAVPQRPGVLPSVSTNPPAGSFPEGSKAAHEPAAGALPPLAALMMPSTAPLWSLAAASAPATTGAFSAAQGGLSAAATLLSSSLLASPNPTTRLPPTSSGGGLALPSIAALLGAGIPVGGLPAGRPLSSSSEAPPPVSRGAHPSDKE